MCGFSERLLKELDGDGRDGQRGQHMMTTTSTTIAHPDAGSRGSLDPIRPHVIQRIQAEYVEMPGLTLTLPQAARLWGLNVGQSERLLSELIDRGFLMRDMKGAYRRRGCPRCS
jgi:hypothetical protein